MDTNKPCMEGNDRTEVVIRNDDFSQHNNSVNAAWGKIVAPGVVRFERYLPPPIERVWAYLTEPEKRRLWLAGGKMELAPGGKVELQFHHSDLSPVFAGPPKKFGHWAGGHILSGKVISVSPPREITFTWEAGSQVTFELSEANGQVLLTLTHRMLPDHPEAQKSVCSSWHAHFKILADRLNQKTPEPFWMIFSELRIRYDDLLRK